MSGAPDALALDVIEAALVALLECAASGDVENAGRLAVLVRDAAAGELERADLHATFAALEGRNAL